MKLVCLGREPRARGSLGPQIPQNPTFISLEARARLPKGCPPAARCEQDPRLRPATAPRGSAPAGAGPCPPPGRSRREWKPDPALSFSFPGRIAITGAPCAPARPGTERTLLALLERDFLPRDISVLQAKLGVWEGRVWRLRPRARQLQALSAHSGRRAAAAPTPPPVMQVRAWPPNRAARTRTQAPHPFSATEFPGLTLSDVFSCLESHFPVLSQLSTPSSPPLTHLQLLARSLFQIPPSAAPPLLCLSPTSTRREISGRFCASQTLGAGTRSLHAGAPLLSSSSSFAMFSWEPENVPGAGCPSQPQGLLRSLLPRIHIPVCPITLPADPQRTQSARPAAAQLAFRSLAVTGLEFPGPLAWKRVEKTRIFLEVLGQS